MKWDSPAVWSQSIDGCTEEQTYPNVFVDGVSPIVSEITLKPTAAPPLPAVIAARTAKGRVQVKYRFPDSKPARAVPWQIVSSVIGQGKAIPLTVHIPAKREGTFSQSIGLARGRLTLLVSVRAETGARTNTVRVPVH